MSTSSFGTKSAMQALDDRARAAQLHLCLDFTAARKGTLWLRVPGKSRRCVCSVPIPDGEIEAAAVRLDKRWES